jgi:hypothetical protein
MLRSSRAASHGSLILFQAPSRRHRMARRRTVIGAVLALAAVSAVAGTILTRGDGEAPAHNSPLSYLPN